MLATARRCVPSLVPLLMSRTVFETYSETYAVAEDTPAGEHPPDALLPEECELYRAIRCASKGRLEQEFLPAALVGAAIGAWHSGQTI